MKKRIQILFGIILLLISPMSTFAQCAMCRASVSSTISDGRNDVGNGINTGILYMLSFPYLIVMVGGYLWYKRAQKNQIQQAALIAQIQKLKGI